MQDGHDISLAREGRRVGPVVLSRDDWTFVGIMAAVSQLAHRHSTPHPKRIVCPYLLAFGLGWESREAGRPSIALSAAQRPRGSLAAERPRILVILASEVIWEPFRALSSERRWRELIERRRPGCLCRSPGAASRRQGAGRWAAW
jgi:hypothetical protein